MPRATIVVPAYNVAATLPATLRSLLAQTYRDFEIVVVDDGSTDATRDAVETFAADPRLRCASAPRIRIVAQANRGLAGARNSGIHAASGEYVGFCDADDLWAPEKLAAHVDHLDRARDVGISYSGSALIDEDGRLLRVAQRPRLTGVDAAHVFKRNPVGNGSAPVLRRAALNDIRWRPARETARDWWFDETFRQSEDIECWLRLSLTTGWRLEGVPGLLTSYRVNGGGLSAGISRQLAAWERMVEKLTPLDPDFFARHAPAARSYQLRYLCRRAISSNDPARAAVLARRSLRSSLRPLFEEPLKTGVTLGAALALAAPGSESVARTVLPCLGARRAG